MTHPTWPDGDLIQIGHQFHTGDPSTVSTVSGIYKSDDRHRIAWVDPDRGTTGPTLLTSEITRVLPPRPVAGDMPEGLARWLEQTELRAAVLLDPTVTIAASRRKALAQLFEWARSLMVVDAEIVDDDRPRCDATKMEPLEPGGQLWTCHREAGHSRRLLVNPTAGVETDAGHFDPERGWW